jgi:hypothetical protein
VQLRVASAEPRRMASTPADLFMQSIVTRDGKLGWQQLCPAVQLETPASQLAQQADAQRVTEADVGLTLNVEFVETRLRPDGARILTGCAGGAFPVSSRAVRGQSTSTMTTSTLSVTPTCAVRRRNVQPQDLKEALPLAV